MDDLNTRTKTQRYCISPLVTCMNASLVALICCSMRILCPRRMCGLRGGRLQGERDVQRRQRASAHAPLARGEPAYQLQVCCLPPRLLVDRVPDQLPMRVVRQHGKTLSSTPDYVISLESFWIVYGDQFLCQRVWMDT